MPTNGGDIILEKEKNDEHAHQLLEKRRREGVRDEDIRWWWNLEDEDRMMMLKEDETARMTLFIKCREEGLTEEQAAERMRKYHPIWGDPEDTTHTQGDDTPIPEELKDRINIYIQKRANDDSEKFKKELEQLSTFNALVRKEIRAGKL